LRKKCGSTASRRLGALALLFGCVALLAGCRAAPAYQGVKHEVLATYQYRRLRTDIPGSVRVPAAIAAAESSLRNRGYAVRSSTATEDRGRVEAVPPDAGLFEEVVVSAAAVGGATRVDIVIEPMGDQVRSRAIMDGILSRLGL
jgi:hypothetical protein